MGGLCSKTPNSLMVLGEEFLKAKFRVRAAECVTFFWLVGGEVTGWYSRDLVLSQKLLSSTRVGAWAPTEELKDILLCLSIPWGGTRPLLYHCINVSWLLLLCFCISSLPFEILQTRNKAFIPGKAPQGFNRVILFVALGCQDSCLLCNLDYLFYQNTVQSSIYFTPSLDLGFP